MPKGALPPVLGPTVLLSALVALLLPAPAWPSWPGGRGEPRGPPPALACLTRWYALEPLRVHGIWGFRLPDGSLYPFDDGIERTPEEKVDSADLEDTLSSSYLPGPIRPVTESSEDPGCYRFDPLFRATYGQTARKVDVVRIGFMGRRIMVHRRVVDAFLRVQQRLREALRQEPSLERFFTRLGGAWHWRNVAGTRRLSVHGYGIAIDLNVAHGHYWRWQRPRHPPRWRNKVPQAIVDAFEAEGFIWGGRWYHYDTMHFEYRPELLDPACRGAPERSAARAPQPTALAVD